MTEIGLDDSDEWDDPEPRSVSVTVQNVVGVSAVFLYGMAAAAVMVQVSEALAPVIGVSSAGLAVVLFFAFLLFEGRTGTAEWAYDRSIDAAERLLWTVAETSG